MAVSLIPGSWTQVLLDSRGEGQMHTVAARLRSERAPGRGTARAATRPRETPRTPGAFRACAAGFSQFSVSGGRFRATFNYGSGS